MKKIFCTQFITVLAIVGMLFLFERCSSTNAQTYSATADETPAEAKNEKPVTESQVFITRDLSSDGLMAVYDALGRKASGKVAVKISTGEPGGENYLQPELIKDLVQRVNGTIVEGNTAYGGGRASTAMHKQVAKDHGFTDIAPFDILDEDGYIALPFPKGKNIQEDYVGSHFENYDFYVILSHFKGHAMAGLGGALKNMSIGIASPEGKMWIHTAGATKTTGDFSPAFRVDQDAFLESMAEAAGAVAGRLGDKIIYINVMNRLSVDCDCDSSPADPTMSDIGILASLDPVALDQACVDLVYAAHDGHDLVKRMESRHGIHTIEHGEEIGLGSRTYNLVNLDD